METMKKTIWVADSLKALKKFPATVQDSIGYSLQKVQEGVRPSNAKALKGFKPAVMEIISDHRTNTYRVVYSVKLGDAVYVLHCFQKKSKQGIKTPKQALDLIKQRLCEAQSINQYRR